MKYPFCCLRDAATGDPDAKRIAWVDDARLHYPPYFGLRGNNQLCVCHLLLIFVVGHGTLFLRRVPHTHGLQC